MNDLIKRLKQAEKFNNANIPEWAWGVIKDEQKCGWQKTDHGYDSDCGHELRHRSWGWEYCPYCGKKITFIRKDWL